MQLDFFDTHRTPSGFSYHPDFISPSEEKTYLNIFSDLKFQTFEMHGVEARRKIVHFGMKYDFRSRTASKYQDIPEWLLPLKEKSEVFLQKEVSQILVTHYPLSAPIGWHLDAPPFESLLGVSLLSPCRFLLKKESEKFEIILHPRSAYIIQGEARWKWQHHIPPVKFERYSITFRTLV